MLRERIKIKKKMFKESSKIQLLTSETEGIQLRSCRNKRKKITLPKKSLWNILIMQMTQKITLMIITEGEIENLVYILQ